MKRFIMVLGAIFLGIQRTSASDTTGALVLIPIAGGVVGLVIGAAVCTAICWGARQRRKIWFSLPLFGAAGFVLPVVAIMLLMAQHRDKIVCTFGRYDHMRGGMGVITVPHDFSRSDLAQFYGQITNRQNAILSWHEFAVALVHQGNGIDQVYLNVYPNLDMTTEYRPVNDEVRRQMDIVLKQRQKAIAAPK